MNDVSWGTRENVQPTTNGSPEKIVVNEPNQTSIQKLMSNFSSKDNEDGFMDFTFGGLFRCMLCTRPKPSDDLVLTHLSTQLELINEKVDNLES